MHYTAFAIVSHEGKVRFNVSSTKLTQRDFREANLVIVKDVDKFRVMKDRYNAYEADSERVVGLDRALELVEIFVGKAIDANRFPFAPPA